ncbi:U6 snRNA-associated Sm-like protein LSm6 [Hyphopichia burtonii NRRL Y-1933]|uniref:U6 snRNA-associated Sm-like protein LSm6 n=1 Tax=Hyphopichia burtonii NRRL Y-1933 TaxID=984485 RepID=A0A1E4RMS9_9ASCO|nr:U6 snRNA-associated Sm-like protein LSm6 [Hyphopichia burtonii NRRL Y-1933]ODV68572.1 U6 snRNA-associated Sm-like protein LSm6 [Hyphopichia burtonii NRRL Y-1933]
MTDVVTPSASITKTNPSNFLSTIIGSSVVVKLHNGVEYSGNLQSIDGYMNIVLDDAKEHVGGIESRTYGDVFIRGNNVLYISEA